MASIQSSADKVEINKSSVGSSDLDCSHGLDKFIIKESKVPIRNTKSMKILRQSAKFSNMRLHLDVRDMGTRTRILLDDNQLSPENCGTIKARILLDGQLIAEHCGMTKTSAKLGASNKALDKLRCLCWTIQKKSAVVVTVITPEELNNQAISGVTVVTPEEMNGSVKTLNKSQAITVATQSEDIMVNAKQLNDQALTVATQSEEMMVNAKQLNDQAITVATQSEDLMDIVQKLNNQAISGITYEEMMENVRKLNHQAWSVVTQSKEMIVNVKKLNDQAVVVVMADEMNASAGVAELTPVNSVIHRAAVGLVGEQDIKGDFTSKVTTFLKNYRKSSNQDDLVFSLEFSKEELAIIHDKSVDLGLEVKSEGSRKKQFLTVGRKLTVELVEHIINNGGTTSKYDLIPPGNFMQEECAVGGENTSASRNKRKLDAINKNEAISVDNVGKSRVRGDLSEVESKDIAELLSVTSIDTGEDLEQLNELGVEEFTSKLRAILQDYARSGNQNEMFFPRCFGKNKHTIILQECRRLGLKTSTEITPQGNYVVVCQEKTSANQVTPSELLEEGPVSLAPCNVDNQQDLDLMVERDGLELDLVSKVKVFLEDYVRSSNQNNLVLSEKFIKKEREIILHECRRLGLKTYTEVTPHGKYVVVCQDKTSANQVRCNELLGEEPISLGSAIKLQGLGLMAKPGSLDLDFTSTVKVFLVDYARSSNKYNLVFSDKFGKKQRKIILSVCKELGLYGNTKCTRCGMSAIVSQTGPASQRRTLGAGSGDADISQPLSGVVYREDLPTSAEDGVELDFTSQVKEFLLDYAKSSNQNRLAFSEQFVKKERNIILNESRKLWLNGSIKSKRAFVGRGNTSVGLITREELMGEESKLGESISEDNIGNKLLRKMGWTGGGLGKEGNKGIVEPVFETRTYGREGLGVMAEQGMSLDFFSKVKAFLMDYAMSTDHNDLTLSSEFTKEERTVIYKECRRLNLEYKGGSQGGIVIRKRPKVKARTEVRHSQQRGN